MKLVDICEDCAPEMRKKYEETCLGRLSTTKYRCWRCGMKCDIVSVFKYDEANPVHNP